MTILQSGIAKSGNVWLFRILKLLLDANNIEYKSYIKKQPIYEVSKSWELSIKDQNEIDVIDFEYNSCYSRISSVYRMPVDLEEVLRTSSIIWTHSSYKKNLVSKYSKIAHHVYIYRDPRATIISMAHFLTRDYGKTFLANNYSVPDLYIKKYYYRKLSEWIDHLSSLIEIRKHIRVHTICYDKLKDDSVNEIQRLSKHLNINLDKKTALEIERETSFKKMKITDPLHVRAGKKDDYMKQLSKLQILLGGIAYKSFSKKLESNSQKIGRQLYFIKAIFKLTALVEKVRYFKD